MDEIKDAIGVIIKLHPDSGILSIKEPKKTTVFFKACHFRDKNKTQLRDFDLQLGFKLCVNAKKQSESDKPKYFAEYRAVRVWRPSDPGVEIPILNLPNKRRTAETGLYDSNYLQSDGNVQKVFPDQGFIILNNDPKNTVYFTTKHITGYKNVTDLTKILKIGDSVLTNAVRSTNKNAKTRWQAVRVWKLEKRQVPVSENAEWMHSNTGIKQDTVVMKNKMLNQKGIIYLKKIESIIKVERYQLVYANHNSCIFYDSDKKIDDIMWAFNDDAEVKFDAVKVSSRWEAVLVWKGNKPSYYTSESHLEDYCNLVSSVCKHTELASCTSSEDPSMLSRDSKKKIVARHRSRDSDITASNIETNFIETFEKENLNLGINIPKISNISWGDTPYSDEEPENYDDDTYKITSHESFEKSIYSRENKEKIVYGHKSSTSKFSTSNEKTNFVETSEEDNLNLRINIPKHSNINWGDTPYSDEEYDEPEYYDDCAAKVTSHKSFEKSICSIQNEDNIVASSSQNDDNNFKFQSDENNLLQKNKDGSPELGRDLSQGNDYMKLNTEISTPPKSSIKIYDGIAALVSKVYNMYAEVKSEKLSKPVVIRFSNFYYNTHLAEDNYEDLKEIIKIGDIVHLNYFEIIDDLGKLWQNLTMAWHGMPPSNIKQLSVAEFIKTNNIKITLPNKEVVDTQSNMICLQNSDEQNTEKLDKANINEEIKERIKISKPRKFLSLAYSSMACNNQQISDDSPKLERNLDQINDDKSLNEALPNEDIVEAQTSMICFKNSKEENTKKFVQTNNNCKMNENIEISKPQKFLSLAYDNCDSDQGNDISEEDDSSSSSTIDKLPFLQDQIFSTPSSMQKLIKEVSNHLCSKVYSHSDSQVKFKKLAEEVIDMLRNSSAASQVLRDCKKKCLAVKSESQAISVAKVCVKNNINEQTFCNTEVQTIATGFVAGHNIYPS